MLRLPKQDRGRALVELSDQAFQSVPTVGGHADEFEAGSIGQVGFDSFGFRDHAKLDILHLQDNGKLRLRSNRSFGFDIAPAEAEVVDSRAHQSAAKIDAAHFRGAVEVKTVVAAAFLILSGRLRPGVLAIRCPVLCASFAIAQAHTTEIGQNGPTLYRTRGIFQRQARREE